MLYYKCFIYYSGRGIRGRLLTTGGAVATRLPVARWRERVGGALAIGRPLTGWQEVEETPRGGGQVDPGGGRGRAARNGGGPGVTGQIFIY